MTLFTPISERPSSYPIANRPCSLFFNGERMPNGSQLWERIVQPLHDIKCSDAVGWQDVVEVVWGMESVGKIASCAPAVFIYAIQELILYALTKRVECLERLCTYDDLANHDVEIMTALVEGGFQMRELALKQRLAYWSVGYEEWDQRELNREISLAFHLPLEASLAPHQRDRQIRVKLHLERQIKQFHQLAQSGDFPKELRRRFHTIVMPDDAFLRLVC